MMQILRCFQLKKAHLRVATTCPTLIVASKERSTILRVAWSPPLMMEQTKDKTRWWIWWGSRIFDRIFKTFRGFKQMDTHHWILIIYIPRHTNRDFKVLQLPYIIVDRSEDYSTVAWRTKCMSWWAPFFGGGQIHLWHGFGILDHPYLHSSVFCKSRDFLVHSMCSILVPKGFVKATFLTSPFFCDRRLMFPNSGDHWLPKSFISLGPQSNTWNLGEGRTFAAVVYFPSL